VRYEQLAADPHHEIVALLARGEIEARTEPRAALMHHADAIDRMPPPDSWRRRLSTEAVDVLMTAHHDVIVALGYDPDDRTLTSS